VSRFVYFARALPALVVLAASAGAQLSTATGVGAFLERTTPAGWQSTTRFEPSIRIDNRWAQLGADVFVTGGATALRTNRAELSFLAAPPPLGAFRLTTQVNASRFAFEGRDYRTSSIESALSFGGSKGGMWVGARAESGDSASRRLMPHIGLWRSVGRVIFTLNTQPHQGRVSRPSNLGELGRLDSTRNDTTGTYTYWRHPVTTNHGAGNDSGITGRIRQWSDIQASLGWAGNRIAVDARAGFRPKLDVAPSTLWGRVTATAAVAPRLSIVASAGTDAARLWIGAPSTRFVSLGARIAPAALVRPAPPPHVRPAPASLELERVDSGYVVSVRVPQARFVELSGDFNQWHPIVLRQVRPDVWEAPITLARGTYRINLRVNGDRWMAPPGLAAIDDEFNGTVGLLVVR
jgi:hypothetical protein